MTSSAALTAAVTQAIAQRTPLTCDDRITAYRLINGAADGLPSITVDRYDTVAVINLYTDQAHAREDALIAAIAAVPGLQTVYIKRRPRSAARLSPADIEALAPSTPVWGPRADQAVARETTLQFLIRPGSGLSTGLFLDMRETRAHVQSLASGRTVLNLFAYTCAFGVAAIAGGAQRTLNIDAARPALSWGQANYGLNDFSVDPYDFVYGNVFDWLARLARRNTQFDFVIVDPPSFSTVKGRRFTVSSDYATLVKACAGVTSAGGLLLCCANEARLSRRAFQAGCLRGVVESGRTAHIVSYEHEPAVDFPLQDGDEGHLKVLLLEL